MKQAIAILIATGMLMTLCACNQQPATEPAKPGVTTEVMRAQGTGSINSVKSTLTTPGTARKTQEESEDSQEELTLDEITSETADLYLYVSKYSKTVIVNSHGKQHPEYAIDKDGNIVRVTDEDGNALKKKDITVVVLAENTEILKPEKLELEDVTSEYAELYLYTPRFSEKTFIVDIHGNQMPVYDVDNEGNIVRDDIIIVLAENTEILKPVERIDCTVRESTATLFAVEEPVSVKESTTTHVVQYPVSAELELTITPADATVGVLILSSTNPYILYCNSKANADILSDATEEMLGLQNGEIAVVLDENGKVTVNVTCIKAGIGKVHVEALSGEVYAEGEITVRNGKAAPLYEQTYDDYINATPEETIHRHEYTNVIVPPTYDERGYTLYTCVGCGYSYCDDYTPHLIAPESTETPHVHSYTSSVVPPTAIEGGYTMYSCTCGDTYTDTFTSPIGTS